jgi:mRNA interferase MazF
MRQGDVIWFRFEGKGSEPAGRRPALVIQDDRFNRSAIGTAVVAAITSNLRLAAMPGNVRRTLDRARVGKPLGTLSPGRMDEVLRGLALVFGLDRLIEQ